VLLVAAMSMHANFLFAVIATMRVIDLSVDAVLLLPADHARCLIAHSPVTMTQMQVAQ